MKNCIIRILLTIWQLPQILLARIFVRKGKYEYLWTADGVDVYFGNGIDGISLGDRIVINPNCYEGLWLAKHEFGHVIQSRILGWFYIPIILIPSLLWYIFVTSVPDVYNVSEKESTRMYYLFYTEKWANRIMRIDIEDVIKKHENEKAE